MRVSGYGVSQGWQKDVSIIFWSCASLFLRHLYFILSNTVFNRRLHVEARVNILHRRSVVGVLQSPFFSFLLSAIEV